MILFRPKSLSGAEFAALVQLSMGPIRDVILTKDHDRLIKFGYAQKMRGELVITDSGLEQITKGRSGVD
jgi:hypothetical protein